MFNTNYTEYINDEEIVYMNYNEEMAQEQSNDSFEFNYNINFN